MPIGPRAMVGEPWYKPGRILRRNWKQPGANLRKFSKQPGQISGQKFCLKIRPGPQSGRMFVIPVKRHLLDFSVAKSVVRVLLVYIFRVL